MLKIKPLQEHTKSKYGMEGQRVRNEWLLALLFLKLVINKEIFIIDYWISN